MASSPFAPFYYQSFQFENHDAYPPPLFHGSPRQHHRPHEYLYDQPQLHSTPCCPPPVKRLRTTHPEHNHQETITTSYYSPVASLEEAFDLESELELLLHELSSSERSTAASPAFFFSPSSASSPSSSPSPSSSFSSSSDEPAAALPLSFSPPFFTLEAPSPMSSPSSSGASSPARAPFSSPPASPQPPPANTTQAKVQVCLSHKPRGSGGSYVPLAPEQHIRVTKGKGKRLRLAVESDLKFEWSHLQLNLIDAASGASCNDHFTIWNHKSSIEDDEEAGGTRAEVEVTVNKLSPQLHFQVVIDANEQEAAWTWRGHSTCFGTHNNGKDRSVRALKKQRKEALRAAAAAAARERKLRNKARSSSRA